MKRLGVKRFTEKVLTDLNYVYESEASTSFTDALVKSKSSGLEKKSPRRRKGGKRSRHKKKSQRQ